MAVNARSLENPERGQDLTTRERPAEEEKADELRAFKERLAAAKASTPNDTAPHCADCFRRGWRAALGAVEG